MEQILPLEIRFSHEGAQQAVFPTLIRHGGDLILVDCGYPGFLPLLEQAIQASGFSPAALTRVVITHHDDDHMGALAELLEAYPRIQVFSSAEEAPYISGRKKSLRLRQAETLQSTLPPEMQAWGLAFQQRLAAARASLAMLLDLPADTYHCFHGGTLRRTT